MRVFLFLATVLLILDSSNGVAAELFAEIAVISPTAPLATSTQGALCRKDGARIVCDEPSPIVDASGNVSTTGYVSATAFYGDGSNLTGIAATVDNIVSGTTNITANNSGAISFTTNGSEAVVINSSGNVGIGTTAPGAKLTVAGGDVLIGPSDNTRKLSFFNYKYHIRAYSGLEFHTGDIFRWQTSGGVERMRLDANGNVGIGTTIPSKTLHVIGDSKIDGALQIAEGSNTCSSPSDVGTLKAVGSKLFMCITE